MEPLENGHVGNLSFMEVVNSLRLKNNSWDLEVCHLLRGFYLLCSLFSESLLKGSALVSYIL